MLLKNWRKVGISIFPFSSLSNDACKVLRKAGSLGYFQDGKGAGERENGPRCREKTQKNVLLIIWQLENKHYLTLA